MSELDPLRGCGQTLSHRYRYWLEGRNRQCKTITTISVTLAVIVLVIVASVAVFYTPNPEDSSSEIQSRFQNPLLHLSWPIEDEWKRAPAKSTGPTTKTVPVSDLTDEKAILAQLEDRKTRDVAASNPAMTLQPGHPAFYHRIAAGQAALDDQGQALFVEVTSRAAASALQLNKSDIQRGMLGVFSLHGSQESLCQYGQVPICDPTVRYRKHNGTCNNLEHPMWGSAPWQLRRMLPPDYADGISAPRSTAQLPLTRVVSLAMQGSITHEDARNLTLFFSTWGQFVTHDMTSTATSKGANGSKIACCGVPEMHPECFPITLPADDPTFSKYGQQCMEFVRSAPSPLCTLGPREQFDQITAYIDGSNIYGSDRQEGGRLRQHRDGNLRTRLSPDGRTLLPISNKADDGCNQPDQIEQSRYCFKSGDTRVNEQIGLTAMHTIWVRQHVRIANHLEKMNPHWNDDQIYDEARRIVGAQMQHITYAEYLPLLLGPALTKALNLNPLEEGYDTSYNPQIDASISNEFATAALRFGHSMLPGLVAMEGPGGRNVEYVQLNKVLFSPFGLWEPQVIDSIFRGHAIQPPRALSTDFTPQAVNQLFQKNVSVPGLDLLSINIHRGRDHGLPPYVAYRKPCNLPPVNSFKDLEDIFKPDSLARVQNVYKNVEDVDLYIGLLSEVVIPGLQVGPVAACILADQFVRLKRGDRFWYETQDPLLRFTPEQLQTLRSTTLARVICDNGDAMDAIQKRVMETITPENPRLPCFSTLIPELDISLWEDDPLNSTISAAPSTVAPLMTTTTPAPIVPRKIENPILTINSNDLPGHGQIREKIWRNLQGQNK